MNNPISLLYLPARHVLWCQSIIDGYLLDEDAKHMLAKLVVDGSSVPHYSLHDGIIKFGNRIWIGNIVPLQHSILEAIHSTLLGDTQDSLSHSIS